MASVYIWGNLKWSNQAASKNVDCLSRRLIMQMFYLSLWRYYR